MLSRIWSGADNASCLAKALGLGRSASDRGGIAHLPEFSTKPPMIRPGATELLPTLSVTRNPVTAEKQTDDYLSYGSGLVRFARLSSRRSRPFRRRTAPSPKRLRKKALRFGDTPAAISNARPIAAAFLHLCRSNRERLRRTTEERCNDWEHQPHHSEFQPRPYFGYLPR